MSRAGGWTRIAGMVFVLAILGMMTPALRAQQGGAAAAGRTAGDANKNVTTALKDLPADQLVPTMRFFAYSLGVECEFCHVDGDDSKDDKDTKKTARAMINMEIAINKDNFMSRTQVTCYTCHQGANQPRALTPIESTKIIPGGTAPPPPPPAGRGGAPAAPAAPAVQTAAPAMPTADAILAKYAQALGGEQALRKITGRSITGVRDTAGRNTQDVPWQQVTFELYEKAPNLRTMIAKTPNGQTTATGFDGSSSWAQNANGVVNEANGIALARAKRAADFYEPLDLKQEYTQTRVRADKIDGRDVYVLVGALDGDTPERLSFDKESGLLVRRVAMSQNVVAAGPTQTDYLDYRDANGVKYPSTIKVYDVMGNPMYTVLHLNKVDFSTPVDAGKFTKPESKPQPGRGGRGGQ
jgi:photosynthetic reaction center cytochrome c subunit